MESAPPLRNEFNPNGPKPDDFITIIYEGPKAPDGLDTSPEAICYSMLTPGIEYAIDLFAPSKS